MESTAEFFRLGGADVSVGGRRRWPLNLIRQVMAEKAAHKAALAALMSETSRGDAAACRRILNGVDVDDAICCLSTSEQIAVALAFGRLDLLPTDYGNFRHAWQRLDRRQRDLVDTVARAPWDLA